MQTKKFSLPAMAAVGALALLSCKDKGADSSSETKKKSEPAVVEQTPKLAPAHAAMPMKMDKSKDVAHAKEVWAGVTGYQKWSSKSDAPLKSKRPHGAFVRVFYNDTMKAAVAGEGAWPSGSVIVKENYMPNAAKDGPGMMGIVTVMQKDGDKWFWAKFKADGSIDKMPPKSKMPGMPIVGYEKLKCIGCHDGEAKRDFVISKLAAK